MDAATTTSPPRGFTAFLAGLQCGMLGAICMLGCLGVAAEWQQRSFWTSENLMASAFYGARAIHSGFASETISGTAVYLAMYSLLGALFAGVVGLRMPRLRIVLLAMTFGLGWYWLSFRLLWKAAMPLVALLHVERSTAFAHVIYGLVLGSYPAMLATPSQAVVEADPAAGDLPSAGS